jgi:hypothetical protein
MLSLTGMLNHIRAVELAVMYLTRDPNIVVNKSPAKVGDYDLAVSLRNLSNFNPLFMVEIRSVRSIAEYRHSISFTNQERAFLKISKCPVVLFVFDMSNDQGYFRWLKEPVPGQPELILRSLTDIQLSRITNSLIARIKNQSLNFLNMPQN